MAASDDLVPFTSPWWLDRLGRQLDGRRSTSAILDQYYNGSQALRFATDEFKKTVKDRFARFSANFCKPVVQALEERLTVVGFNWDNDAGSKKAWAIWQANNLDAQSQKAHREAIIKGNCPVIITTPGEDGIARIRVQKPEEVIVGYGDDPLERAVALKRWKNAGGVNLATLYYADRIERYQKAGREWVGRTVGLELGEDPTVEHSIGVVPVVDLVNDPDLDNEGISELAAVVPLQDALNKSWIDLLTASEFGAFRQRWATGLEIPTDPETHKPVEDWQAAVDRIWSTAAVDAKFGDFDQTDVSGMMSAIDECVREIAALTRTPYHYFLTHGGQPPSGESLRGAETGLVSKARRRTRDYGDGWEEIERVAFLAQGDKKRGTFRAAEALWRDPETRSEAEHVDALVKLQAIDIPDEQLWADAGYTPTQIAAFLEMRAREPQAPVITLAPTTVPETATRPAGVGAPPADAPPAAA